MGAPDILFRLAEAGIELKPAPDGTLRAGPREALTDELRDLIRAHRVELLKALAGDVLPDLAAESRRQRVLAMLAERPGIQYAVVVDNPDTDPVIVALGIRGQATCELCIPREKFDQFLLLDLIERHWGTVH